MGCWALCALTLLALAHGFAAYFTRFRAASTTHLTPMAATGVGEKPVLSFGIVLPHSNFLHRVRSYQKTVSDTFTDIKKKYPGYKSLFQYDVVPVMEKLQLTPSPTDILRILCHKFLIKNVSAIMYIPSVDPFGANAASAQYFLQLTGYLGIPVIVWNAIGNGLEMGNMLPTVKKRLSGLFTASPTVAVDPPGAEDSNSEEDGDNRTTPSTGHRTSPHPSAASSTKKAFNSIFLQLAPTLIHQALAMLSIMRRYSWHQFSIVTTQITGYNTFIEAVKDHIQVKHSGFSILTIVRMESTERDELLRKLGELRNTDTRIILLYATKEEASAIFSVSKDLDLTGKDYVWIVTQSVIGNINEAVPSNFSPGMIGVHFDTGETSIHSELDKGIRVFFGGLELFVNDHHTENVSLHPNLSCSGEGNSRWANGELFYKYLQNVSIQISSLKPKLEFGPEGAIKYAELQVMNLNEQLQWAAIGTWNGDRLDIKDIVWPGNSHVPPPGVPEKFHLKVTFLEEPPFVMLTPRDPMTGKCINKGVNCRVAKDSEMIGVNRSMSDRNSSYSQCCSGFCIDLLQKFANDLGFTFELVRVEDDVWGTEINGKWNGLVGALLNHSTDVVMTALNINSFREAVIDFTVPFMETGIAIVVAKRTGIVSPKAFLEPFDTVSWLLILLVSIQVAALAIFLFEWLSPTGYDMKIQPPRDHKFSLFRTYWLVWAILFGAAVNVDCPRGYTARCMSNLWAMFAVVFLAIYTANLAAFMITREEYYDLAGIEDKRLLNPYSIKPPFKYGTMPMGNSETIISKAFPEMENYMKQHNKKNVWEGVQAVKRGELNAFIYDATVLDYLVSQDDECKLLTVGSWYAMTGYGVAFPRNSKHLNNFNKHMMMYRENGDLERLQRFWMQGACKPDKQRGKEASKPLSLEQFMSAFLLLGSGMLFAILLLLLEHIYFKYLRKHLAKKDTGGCCTLISLSMGRSLTFRGAVYEAQDMLKNHRCRDPICDTHLWKVRYELDMAKLKIRQLEKELYSRGYPHSNRPYYIPISYNEYSDYVLHSRDMTRNHVTTNEPVRGYSGVPTKYHSGYYYSPVKNEITEIETVL